MNLTTILIIINVFAALSIIVLALMQTSKGDMGSAFGGGGSQSMFGSRGSANFLSRTTATMCAVFFISSLALAYIYAQRNVSGSVVAPSVIEEVSEVPTIDEDQPVVDEDGVPTIGDSAPGEGDAATPVSTDDAAEAADELPVSDQE